MARPSHYQILKKMGIVTGHFNTMTSGHCIPTHSSGKQAQLYIPSTTNIELILWQTQLIRSADNGFPFQDDILPHPLHCMNQLILISYLNFKSFRCRPKRPALPRHIKV